MLKIILLSELQHITVEKYTFLFCFNLVLERSLIDLGPKGMERNNLHQS